MPLRPWDSWNRVGRLRTHDDATAVAQKRKLYEGESQAAEAQGDHVGDETGALEVVQLWEEGVHQQRDQEEARRHQQTRTCSLEPGVVRGVALREARHRHRLSRLVQRRHAEPATISNRLQNRLADVTVILPRTSLFYFELYKESPFS